MILLLRLWMYLLRPSDEKLKRENEGTFDDLRIRLYRLMLRWLLKSYRHYAIFDTVSMDHGRIRIVHELRDLAFESELARNGIDLRSHLVSREWPVVQAKGRYGRCFRYFTWKNLKNICVDGKELSVRHADALSISGNAAANIKISSAEDVIVRSQIEFKAISGAHTSRPVHERVAADIKTVSRAQKEPRSSERLFDGEKVVVRKSLHDDAGDPSSPSVGDSRIAKRGFEIDTTF